MPSFYKNNMYLDLNDNTVKLKLFNDNTWKYVKIKLKKRDLKYISKINGKRFNPEIYMIGKKIFVKFSFEVNELKLTNKELKDRIICGVDLGINNDATLSIMDSSGTILGRHFVNTNNKDRLNHLLNKKRKIQRESGNYKFLGNLHIVNKINSINENDNTIKLKLFVDNTWKYVKFKLKKRDLKHINKINGKRYNPSIYMDGKKIFVKFSFEVESLNLTNKDLKDRIICGVDLGINNDATLSIMDSNGTILGRHFVNTNDKDRLNHLLNKKRKIQRNSGNYKFLGNLHIVNKINSINKNIVNHTCSKIISICLSYGVDVIVFENLRHKFKRAKKSYRQRLHHWKKIAIFNKCYEMAHRNGMRISTVNPCGKSIYA